MSMFTTDRTRRRSRGFTLVLAALVSSIMLAIGASIFTLVRKQVILSSLGRDSQIAFYVADQAAECALYWDARWSYFGTSTPPAFVAPNDPTCDGQHWTPAGGNGRPTDLIVYPTNPTYTMTFQYSPTYGSASYCANVAVEKTLDSQGVITTNVHADGFSTTCATQETDPRALQRSVELHY